jgi:hypothetical protein
VGGAASILNLEQYQCNASTQKHIILYLCNRRRIFFSLHSVESLLEQLELSGVAGFLASTLDPFRLRRVIRPAESLNRAEPQISHHFILSVRKFTVES